MPTNAYIEGKTDFVIESAIFSTDVTTPETTYDIARIISDLTIFEHLDKPYLTGEVSFVDYYSIIHKIDFQGGEKLTVTLKSTHNPSGAVSITKTFYVEKINKSVKVNDQTETVFLRLIEDIGFVSSVKNVNKSYTGDPYSIVNNIFSSYLNRNVLRNNIPHQSQMKVIVPNMHPIEAATWVNQKATNSDGLPFYLFSVLVDNDIRMYSLGNMLNSEPINKNIPYFYWQSGSQAPTDTKYYAVQSYSYENVDHLLSLIRAGVVGSNYTFYDTLHGNRHTVDFDVADDAFGMLTQQQYITGNQSRHIYSQGYKVDGRNISNYNSTGCSRVYSSAAYNSHKTISQENSEGDYKKRLVGYALKNFMTKTPLTIQVSGRDFIMGENRGDNHRSIGNVIRVLFADADTQPSIANSIDKKKSGDYIIYAAKHKFSKERYDTQLLCTKLASYKEDPSLR